MTPNPPENFEEVAIRIAAGLPFSSFTNSVEYIRAYSFVVHETISALRNERERCWRIAKVIPDSKFDLDHEPARTEQQIRDGIAAAIREGK